MMRIVFAMVVLDLSNAAPIEVFISDLVDVKTVAVDLRKINSFEDVEISLKKHSTQFPNITNIDSVVQDYREELYLPDADPIENTIDDTLGSDDLLDVVKNFIAEREPMLQLFLHICFLHPNCYQLDSPISSNTSSSSPFSLEMKGHLMARRTETARNILVNLIKEVQTKIKMLLFKYIEKGVAERGVSIKATQNIIDSVKSIWLSLNNDLEYAKSSIQELFYLLPLDTNEQVQAMVEIIEVVQRIPDKTETLLQEATQEGYQQYIKSSSWDSWKRKGGE